MKRKLKSSDSLRVEYVKFMKEYIALGHMELIKENEIIISGKICYLHHHTVIKENSTSTKLRVVQDA